MKILLIILCILIASPVMCGLEFDSASSGYIDCGQDSSLDFGSGSFTVSAWVKTINASQRIATKRDSVILWLLGTNGDDGTFIIRDSDSNIASVTGGTVSDGDWHHVVGMRDEANSLISVYVDTILSDSAIESSVGSTDSTVDLYIGSSVAYPSYFDGIIDDVRIYNRALSLPEIQSIYHSRGSDNIINGLVGRWLMNEDTDGATTSGAGSTIDISGNGNDGSPTDTPITYRATPIKLIRRPR